MSGARQQGQHVIGAGRRAPGRLILVGQEGAGLGGPIPPSSMSEGRQGAMALRVKDRRRGISKSKNHRGESLAKNLSRAKKMKEMIPYQG